MKPLEDMSLGELAAFISSHLAKHNIEVILTGDGCVSLHSDNQYVPLDLDFIDNRFTKRSRLRKVLSELGFQEENRYFKHPQTQFFLEFPAGPLAVGGEPVRQVVTLRFATGEVKALSPTDCVKDRLAAYYHWGDQQSLDQAELVAQRKDIDLAEIQRWSKKEGKLKEFRRVKNRLEGRPRLTCSSTTEAPA